MEPVLTIAAALGGKSPFVTPLDQKEDSLRSHQRFLLTHHHHSRHQSGSSVECAATGASSGAAVNSTGDEYQHRHFRPPPPSPKAPTVTVTGAAGSKSAAAAHSEVQEAEVEVENSFSDHIAVVHAYDQWQHVYTKHGADAAWRFCRDRFLSHNILNDMRALREHFRAYLSQTGFIDMRRKGGNSGEDDADLETEVDLAADIPVDMKSATTAVSSIDMDTRTVEALVRCVLCAGLYPNIVRLGRFKETTKSPAKTASRRTMGETVETLKIVQSDLTEVSLHPSCLLQRYLFCNCHVLFYFFYFIYSMWTCII